MTEPLTPAERQALAFQAIARVYLTAPDHIVEVAVMEQVEAELERLKDLNLMPLLVRDNCLPDRGHHVMPHRECPLR